MKTIVNLLAWTGIIVGLALVDASNVNATAFASALGGLTEGPQTTGDSGGSTAAADIGDSGDGGSGFGVGQASFYNVSANGFATSDPETNYSGGGSGEWFQDDIITFDGSSFSPPVSNSTAEFFFYAAWSVSGEALFNISMMNDFISYNSHTGFTSSLGLASSTKGGGLFVVSAPFNSVDFLSEPANFAGALQEAWSADAQALAGGLSTGGSVGSSRAFASLSLQKIEVVNNARRITGPMLAMSNPELVNIPDVPSADFDASGGGINAQDFLVWQRNYGVTSGATPSMGDANGDGRVNDIDLIYWDIQFGGQNPNNVVGVAAAVAEPGAAAIGIFAAAVGTGIAKVRRRK